MTKPKTISFLIKRAIFLSLFFCSLLLAYTNPSRASDHDLLNPEANIQNNYEILNARPKILQKNGNPKASAGTILFTFNSKLESFLLLGQENSSKKGGGSYCELGGRAELEPSGKAETFLKTCIREAEEESAKIYKLDPKYVLLNSYTYYNITSNGREEVYIFLKAPYYVSALAILNATEREAELRYKEKSKFKWVKLADLLLCEKDKCEVHDIDGAKETIYLREFFYKTLQNPRVKDILKAIEDTAKPR